MERNRLVSWRDRRRVTCGASAASRHYHPKVSSSCSFFWFCPALTELVVSPCCTLAPAAAAKLTSNLGLANSSPDQLVLFPYPRPHNPTRSDSHLRSWPHRIPGFSRQGQSVIVLRQCHDGQPNTLAARSPHARSASSHSQRPPAESSVASTTPACGPHTRHESGRACFLCQHGHWRAACADAGPSQLQKVRQPLPRPPRLRLVSFILLSLLTAHLSTGREQVAHAR